MTDHLHRDLEKVKEHVLAMGGLAEDALRFARSALISGDSGGLADLRTIEPRIDQIQLTIDDEIIKLLALHQPVASDLRFATAAMKIVNDLERIGDLASTIGCRLETIAGEPQLNLPLQLVPMMEKAARMLKKALNAFVTLDSDLARSVLEDDDEVDALNRQHFETLVAYMKLAPESIDVAVSLLSISRSVERIADMATNIAEDVVFVVDARDIRHPGLQRGRVF